LPLIGFAAGQCKAACLQRLYTLAFAFVNSW